MTNFLITGGAGFIGSHITLKLLQDGHKVKVIDKKPINYSLLKKLTLEKRFSYSQINIKNSEDLIEEFKGIDIIFHFSASADIALGTSNTFIDVQQGTLVTYAVLEAMRKSSIKRLIFPSSSTVYGYPPKIPTPEDSGLLFPTSLYGASKLASEALISSYCYLFDMKSWIFRFGNVIGKNAVRGVLIELIQKLKKNSKELEVLGDGNQLKDYIYIDDCVAGILYALENSDKKINVFNLGTGTTLSVNEIVKIIFNELKLNDVKVNYTEGSPGWKGGGWPGDINVVQFDITKIRNLGWTPKFNSAEAVKKTIKEIISCYYK